jgi:hypothetical protein
MEQTIKKIAKHELLNMLSNFRKEVAFTGTIFSTIQYQVDESGSIVKDKQKQLQKRVTTQITIGASYEKRVNRDLVKQDEEANFTAQAMSGKEYINNEGVIAKDTKTGLKHYLVYTIEHHITPLEVIYYHKGNEIEKDKAIAMGLFMPSYFTPKKTAGRGNVQDSTDFITNSLNIDNIISITLNKTKYLIEN